MKLLVSVLLVFIYIFPVKFIFLPGFLSSRTFYALFFIMWLALHQFSKNVDLNREVRFIINKSCILPWEGYLTALLGLFFITCVSSAINLYWDWTFLSYIVSEFLIIISACGLVAILNMMSIRLDINYMMALIVGACVLQCLLSLLLFIFPFLYDIVYSIIRVGIMEGDAIERTAGIRLIGIGANASFFYAGVACSFGLFCCGYLLKYVRKNKNILILILLALVLLALGSGLARTTQVGAVLVFVYFFFSSGILKVRIKKRVANVMGTFLIIVCSCIIALLFLIQSMPEFEIIFRYAFEAIYNFFEEGRLYTSSSDLLLETIPLPDDIKTWIIGDAKFLDPELKELEEYYMGTDIGWLRVVYCVGIMGLLPFCYAQYYLFRIPNWDKSEILLLFLMFLIFLHKGFVDLTLYVVPIALVASSWHTAKKTL